MDKILFIDALNSIHRANVGFPKSKDIKDPNKKDGRFVSRGPASPEKSQEDLEQDKFILVYNFFRNLKPIIEAFSPDKCFFVLEGHPKFRYDLFPEYKANRIIKNAERKTEINRVFEAQNQITKLLQYLPITIARAADYEADDTIATLCENMKDEDLTVISSDSDYIQLLQKGFKNIKVFDPIRKKVQSSPEYSYIAWKSLVGDKSDNIPGFDGIGTIKAQKMLSNPEDFSNFLKLGDNRSNFQIYKNLIEFRQIPVEDIEFKEGIKRFSILKEEFSNMGLESLIKDDYWNKFVNSFNCLKF